jgi:hypothetical protein
MQLNEKAMKVTLKRTRPSLTKRDIIAEEFVQDELGDAGLVVNKKLFRDPGNPINHIMRGFDRIYHTHKQNTLPFVDAGPRLLPSAHYPEYRTLMKAELDAHEKAMLTYMPDYDKYVQLDIAWRLAQDALKQAGRPKPANYVAPTAEEYPGQAEFQAAMTVNLRFETLPDAPHFLFDEDKEESEKVKREIEVAANNAVVLKMLKPAQHLAQKLAIPIGETGHIFRDSALENIAEAVAQARKLAIEITPELDEVMKELEGVVTTYSAKVEWLRESPINRKEAAAKLDEIAQKMGAFMGAV